MNALANEKILEIQRTAQRVIAAQAGDRAAFGELFVQFEKSIFAIALRRTGNATDAQELVQDVFMQAMQKIEQLRAPEAFGGWLRQITVRMAINRAVRRGPAISVEPELLEATVIGYDSGQQQMDAIRSGAEAGAITQNPIGIGYKCVEAAYKAYKGESLPEVIDTGFMWYDASNIDDEEIQAVLYK